MVIVIILEMSLLQDIKCEKENASLIRHASAESATVSWVALSGIAPEPLKKPLSDASRSLQLGALRIISAV